MSRKKLTEEDISKLLKSSNWESILRNYELPEETIKKYIDKMNWIVLAENQMIPEDLIEKHKHKFLWVTWDAISGGKTNLSEKFMRENFKDINKENISYSQKLSEEFIKEFKEDLDWYWIVRCQNMSADFIMSNWDKIKDNLDDECPIPVCILDSHHSEKIKEDYNREDFVLFLKLNNILN